MKTKIILSVIFVSLAMVLMAGCSNNLAMVSTGSRLPTVSKLALGILKLESTSNAVTADQAKLLLTLWQAYQSMGNSDTTSQVELEALASQIKGSLTDAQLRAIDAMHLTDRSISETLSTWSTNISSNTLSGAPDSAALSQESASSASGTMPTGGSSGASSSGPGGVPPGGSGGMGPGGDSSGLSDVLSGTSTQSSVTATQSPAAAGSAQVNPLLLQAVIRLMETRSQSAE